MLRVYAIPVSLYCAKLRIVLRHKELTWEEIPPPGGYGSAAYKDHVPSGNLPALVDGDLLIADSEAIAEYLEERHPVPAMLPSDAADRARVRERGRFHDTRLEPVLRALFPFIPGRSAPPESFLDAQADQVSTRLEQLSQMLGPVAGEALSLGDCGHPITFAWLDALQKRLELRLVWPDAIRAYRHRLATHSAVADELADYGPKLTTFLDG